MSSISILKTPAPAGGNEWDTLYSAAMRCHKATRPNDQLVSQKIDTFRQFMSQEAIEYLGGFVRRHPRFDTVQGWDQWVLDVEQALFMFSFSEARLHPGFRPVSATSADDVVQKYARGKLRPSMLWQGLDELVGRGALSSVEQRELFWNTLSKEHQEHFVKQCALFDPKDALWEKPESAEAKLAEQSLSRAMVHARMDDFLAYILWCQIFIIGLWYYFFAIILPAIVYSWCTDYRVMRPIRAHKLNFGISIAYIGLCLWCSNKTCAMFRLLRKFEAKHRERPCAEA